MTILSAILRRAKLLKTSTVFVVALSTLAVSPLPAGRAYAQGTASVQTNTADLPPLPLSPIEKAEKDGTILRLSLKDLTKLALQNNLDIAIQDTNEEIYQQRVIQSYGAYDPAITFGLGAQSQKRPNTNRTNQAAGSNSNSTDFAYWNFGFSQAVKTGGTLTANYNSSRSATNQAFALFSPQFNANATVQFTQPLFRNLRTDQVRSNIKLANLDIKTNDSQFKQKVTDTISRIQQQYWDLIGAIRDYEIKRESVRLAQITLRDNRKKVEIGTLAPIGITEAQASMASREVDMIASEERIFNVENTLRGLISNDRNADIWHKMVVPIETPDFKEYQVSLDEAIDVALRNRPELEQLELNINKADVNYNLGNDQRKWQFDLVGSFGSMGVAGPQSIDPSTGQPLIDPNLIGGVGNAYKTLFTGGYTNWAVGFNIQIPLRNRTLEAQMAQLKVQKRQYLMSRKSTEQQIQVDIRNAVQALDTNKKRVETAKVARELAKEQLDGEEKRFQAGLSENFRVLDRQSSLSQAQGAELQALIAYKKSIIDLQRAMYTLLESNDFEIAKTSSESVPALK